MTIDKDTGIDAGQTAIHNLADGTSDSDAATVGQVKRSFGEIDNKLNAIGTRVDRAGAGAAALAALHPLDFDADDKWDFAAGYGNYAGANAVAVGAFYRPDEDTMFSVGGSFGGGENMINAGVSWKLGRGNHVSTSKKEMAKEIAELKGAGSTIDGFSPAVDGRPQYGCRQGIVFRQEGKTLFMIRRELHLCGSLFLSPSMA